MTHQHIFGVEALMRPKATAPPAAWGRVKSRFFGAGKHVPAIQLHAVKAVFTIGRAHDLSMIDRWITLNSMVFLRLGRFYIPETQLTSLMLHCRDVCRASPDRVASVITDRFGPDFAADDSACGNAINQCERVLPILRSTMMASIVLTRRREYDMPICVFASLPLVSPSHL